MIGRISLAMSLVIAALFAVAFTWPVEQATVTSTYGESRWDHFHDGIDIISTDYTIKAAEKGKLLFFWDKSLFPLDNYPGGGNFKVLAHADGRCTIYMHLEDGMPFKTAYTAGDPIGRMGNTGHSINRHLHFSILSHKDQLSVNPLSILPKIEDASPPVIAELAFRIGDRYTIIRDKANIRLTRHYPLLVKIVDSMRGRENLGVFRLSVTHNGREVAHEEFGRISFSKGRLTVNGKEFDELFDPKGYYRVSGITYVSGDNVFTIQASDFAGNTAEKKYTITVRLDLAQ